MILFMFKRLYWLLAAFYDDNWQQVSKPFIPHKMYSTGCLFHSILKNILSMLQALKKSGSLLKMDRILRVIIYLSGYLCGILQKTSLTGRHSALYGW